MLGGPSWIRTCPAPGVGWCKEVNYGKDLTDSGANAGMEVRQHGTSSTDEDTVAGHVYNMNHMSVENGDADVHQNLGPTDARSINHVKTEVEMPSEQEQNRKSRDSHTFVTHPCP